MLMVYFSMVIPLVNDNTLIDLKTMTFYCTNSNLILNDYAILMKDYICHVILNFCLLFSLFNKLFYNLNLRVF